MNCREQTKMTEGHCLGRVRGWDSKNSGLHPLARKSHAWAAALNKAQQLNHRNREVNVVTAYGVSKRATGLVGKAAQ